MYKISEKKGFTLLELLLVVAIMGVLAVIGTPMYLSLQAENEMSITSLTINDILHRAKLKSQAIDGDASWGVEIKKGSLIIFKGTSFVNRNPIYDEEYSISNAVDLSGLSEVIYSSLYGIPNITGEIKLKHLDGRQSQLSINAFGIVNNP